MIKKTDILLLLNDLKDKGEDVDKYISSLYKTASIPFDTLKFINDKRELNVSSFYEKLRSNYNKKRSDLYINIVKEIDNIEEVLTTLAAYNLQVLLFAKKLDSDKEMFYRNTRVEEVTRVLNNYYKTFDIDSCQLLLSLIKSDIKLFEELRKN